MFPAPKIANTGMWLRQLGAGFLLLTLLLSFNVSPAFAACTVGKDHSPVCKLIDPVNAMADNMSGVAFGMAGVGAIGLIGTLAVGIFFRIYRSHRIFSNYARFLRYGRKLF